MGSGYDETAMTISRGRHRLLGAAAAISLIVDPGLAGVRTCPPRGPHSVAAAMDGEALAPIAGWVGARDGRRSKSRMIRRAGAQMRSAARNIERRWDQFDAWTERLRWWIPIPGALSFTWQEGGWTDPTFATLERLRAECMDTQRRGLPPTKPEPEYILMLLGQRQFPTTPDESLGLVLAWLLDLRWDRPDGPDCAAKIWRRVLSILEHPRSGAACYLETWRSAALNRSAMEAAQVLQRLRDLRRRPEASILGRIVPDLLREHQEEAQAFSGLHREALLSVSRWRKWDKALEPAWAALLGESLPVGETSLTSALEALRSIGEVPLEFLKTTFRRLWNDPFLWLDRGRSGRPVRLRIQRLVDHHPEQTALIRILETIDRERIDRLAGVARAGDGEDGARPPPANEAKPVPAEVAEAEWKRAKEAIRRFDAREADASVPGDKSTLGLLSGSGRDIYEWYASAEGWTFERHAVDPDDGEPIFSLGWSSITGQLEVLYRAGDQPANSKKIVVSAPAGALGRVNRQVLAGRSRISIEIVIDRGLNPSLGRLPLLRSLPSADPVIEIEFRDGPPARGPATAERRTRVDAPPTDSARSSLGGQILTIPFMFGLGAAGLLGDLSLEAAVAAFLAYYLVGLVAGHELGFHGYLPGEGRLDLRRVAMAFALRSPANRRAWWYELIPPAGTLAFGVLEAMLFGSAGFSFPALFNPGYWLIAVSLIDLLLPVRGSDLNAALKKRSPEKSSLISA